VHVLIRGSRSLDEETRADKAVAACGVIKLYSQSFQSHERDFSLTNIRHLFSE
jgi:hypothetical protein